MSQPRPNFLVVGAAKAGTTSLHDYLGQHPEIFMSANKEPHYFVRDYGVEKLEDYLALFKGAEGKKAIGESSTLYLFCEESPEWIKSELGPIKIIVVLRNPARRAFSLYGWMVREGYEDATTFDEALQREQARLSDANFRGTCPQFYVDYLYFTSGLYAAQVRRYLEVFGRRNVRIFLFEDFVKAPVGTCREIFEFLNVQTNFIPNTGHFNEGRMPRSIPLQFWLRNRCHRLPFPRAWRQKLVSQLMELNLRRGPAPQADPVVQRTLIDRYRDNLRQLEGLIERDLSKWYNLN